MRKRKKKKIAVAMDEDGYYLNCYGNHILWTKRQIKRARKEARRISRTIKWE